MARGNRAGRSRGASEETKAPAALTLEEVVAAITAATDELKEFIEEKLDGLDLDGGSDGDSADDEGEEEEGFDEGEEDDLTEDEILKMKKAELVSLIKDEELDVDVSEYKKIADLREAVADAYFEEFDD